VVKWPGRENDHSPLLSTEVKNVLNNTATLPHASSVHIQLYCQLTIHNLCCGNITLKKSQIKPCIINKWRGQGHVINLNRIVTVTTATAVCTHPLTHVRMHAHVHTHTHTHTKTQARMRAFLFSTWKRFIPSRGTRALLSSHWPLTSSMLAPRSSFFSKQE